MNERGIASFRFSGFDLVLVLVVCFRARPPWRSAWFLLPIIVIDSPFVTFSPFDVCVLSSLDFRACVRRDGEKKGGYVVGII